MQSATVPLVSECEVHNRVHPSTMTASGTRTLGSDLIAQLGVSSSGYSGLPLIEHAQSHSHQIMMMALGKVCRRIYMRYQYFYTLETYYPVYINSVSYTAFLSCLMLFFVEVITVTFLVSVMLKRVGHPYSNAVICPRPILIGISTLTLSVA